MAYSIHPNNRKPYLCIDCSSPVNRGIKRCKTCDSLFKKNRKPYARTPDHKKIMSEKLKTIPKNTGWKHSSETKNKIAASWTKEKREAARQRGKAFAQKKEWLLKIAESVSGEKNPMWQGGVTDSGYAPGFCKSLKEKIRKRDNYRCQLCTATEKELGYKLSIHHSDYDKTNHDESNLFATCKPCNSRVNINQEFWYGFFCALNSFRESGIDPSMHTLKMNFAQKKGWASVSTFPDDDPINGKDRGPFV